MISLQKIYLPFVFDSPDRFRVFGMPQASAAQSENDPNTPIEHFIVVMQQNHTFDNYFGTYPGANGIPEGVCMPSPCRIQKTNSV